MIKTLVSVATLLVATHTMADCVDANGSNQSLKLDHSEFSKISVKGTYTLELTQASKFTVEVEAAPSLLNHLKTKVSGERLKISPGRCKETPFLVKVSMPELDELDLLGNGQVNMLNTFTGYRIEVDISGNTRGNLDLFLELIELDVTGNTDLILTGGSSHLNVQVLGNGNIDATGLLSNTSYVSYWGNGAAKVHAKDFLKVVARGNAKIGYVGQPNLDVSTKGQATVTPAK